MVEVRDSKELIQAVAVGESVIVITRSMMLTNSIILPDNTLLTGKAQEDSSTPILMFQNSDGIGLTSNNNVENLIIHTPLDHRAIFNTNYVEDMGSFNLENLESTGQLSFLSKSSLNNTFIRLKNINIIAADARGYLEQPQKYGVNVLQGALTIYNLSPDPDSLVTVNAQKITIGQKNAPVIGSGVFIAGYGDEGGRVEVDELTTNNVYSTGKIPEGVADIITGAVFIVNGAHAKSVIQLGETTTYGVNDMVLDAWGEVDEWDVFGAVTSYGPSGIGFVNFGIVKLFNAQAPIETFGLGARGYNQYDGTLEEGHFSSIMTFGDGAIGVQISQEVGTLTFDGGIITRGGVGKSLVKGVITDLPAYALSIKDGGIVSEIAINGNLQTDGDNVSSFNVEPNAVVYKMTVAGEIVANGANSEPLNIQDGGQTPSDFPANLDEDNNHDDDLDE